MSKKNLIDFIKVETPCSEEWNEMKGNDKVRFCGHCAFEVNNISAMTRKQAMRLVNGSNGRICVRYEQHPKTNAPVFADRFYQISRRAGIAAGVLGASLTLSTMTYAQGAPSLVAGNSDSQTEAFKNRTAEPNKTETPTANISGTVIDPNGAVVPGATVTLRRDAFVAMTTSNDEGFYEFKEVPEGAYTITFEFAGFKTQNVEVIAMEGQKSVSNASLELAESFVIDHKDVQIEMVTMGIMAARIDYLNPLHRAVSKNDLEEVKNLIANGENVNGKDTNYDGITPLFTAVEDGNVEIAETLLNFGAKVNAKNGAKQTPLMFLDDDAGPELVRLLIRHGAKVNLVDNDGNTPLILAANYATAEVLQILLDHGADINAQNKEGQTALMNAADAGNLEGVRALILSGADVNLKNKEGDTAWDLASQGEMEELLESHGAIVEDEDEDN